MSVQGVAVHFSRRRRRWLRVNQPDLRFDGRIREQLRKVYALLVGDEMRLGWRTEALS